MKTIIQTIGPLYGDDVNGTVFGQPNGSVYTPPENSLIEYAGSADQVITNTGGNAVGFNSHLSSYSNVATVKVNAQVEWNYVVELATDAAFTNIVSSKMFTDAVGGFVLVSFGAYTVTAGTTYYGRARVVTKEGLVTFLTTTTYTLEGKA